MYDYYLGTNSVSCIMLFLDLFIDPIESVLIIPRIFCPKLRRTFWKTTKSSWMPCFAVAWCTTSPRCVSSFTRQHCINRYQFYIMCVTGYGLHSLEWDPIPRELKVEQLRRGQPVRPQSHRLWTSFSPLRLWGYGWWRFLHLLETYILLLFLPFQSI